MASSTISVVGSANIDLTFRAEKLPRPGETVFGTGFFQGFGGKGANQAVAAARLGGRVAFVGRVGADDFGRTTREQLAREGIDVAHLLTDPERPTGTAAILVDAAGENAIVGVPGANLGLTPADMEAVADLLRSSTIVMAPCETMVETLTATFEIAHAAGRLCLLNPAPARELPDALLRCIDVCVPNEIELRMLTGRPAASLEEARAAAEALRTRGPKQVVVTLGERGSLIVGPAGAEHVPGVAVKAVDTSGAGDAFCGALAFGLARGEAIAVAARRANRAAALSVTRLGTQASFARASEI